MCKQFKIPAIPPSVNQMYKVNYRTRSIYLDESVNKFKLLAIPHIPNIKFSKNAKLSIDVEYHGRFLNKSNGETKRRDGQNLDKCLYDIMFNRWGIDDKFAWVGSWKKVHNDNEEFTLISVKEIK